VTCRPDRQTDRHTDRHTYIRQKKKFSIISNRRLRSLRSLSQSRFQNEIWHRQLKCALIMDLNEEKSQFNLLISSRKWDSLRPFQLDAEAPSMTSLRRKSYFFISTPTLNPSRLPLVIERDWDQNETWLVSGLALGQLFRKSDQNIVAGVLFWPFIQNVYFVNSKSSVIGKVKTS